MNYILSFMTWVWIQQFLLFALPFRDNGKYITLVHSDIICIINHSFVS